VPAAVAAECADRQGRFAEYIRAILEYQQLLADRQWRSYAEQAGVQDLALFEQCVELPADSFPRIERGRSIGEETGVAR
jgi:hypothetical protein